MKPKTLEQLVREIIPLLGTTWVDNYEAKRDWIREVEAALAALKPDAPDLVALAQADEPIELIAPDVFPPRLVSTYTKVCTCEVFGGTSDDFICPVCGGGRF